MNKLRTQEIKVTLKHLGLPTGINGGFKYASMCSMGLVCHLKAFCSYPPLHRFVLFFLDSSQFSISCPVFTIRRCRMKMAEATDKSLKERKRTSLVSFSSWHQLNRAIRKKDYPEKPTIRILKKNIKTTQTIQNYNTRFAMTNPILTISHNDASIGRH